MKNILKLSFLTLIVFAFTINVNAGNKDRVGQAGANELLINPWARSAGLHSLNTSGVQGIEAMRLNVGGLAFVEKTQIAFSSTRWLSGSGVNINALGFAQRLGEDGGVLGVSMMALTPGDIELTTENLPDGGTGETFNPLFLNIGVAYSRSFSNSIHGGVVFRLINQSIANLRASGFAIDAGIQYVTGARDNFKFGIALRNVGTPMRFNGDGLDFTYTNPVNGEDQKGSQRTEKFELPSLLNIGISYDLYFSESEDFRLTVAGSFTSNSFRNDYIGAGLEFGWKNMFMLRGGFKYEDGMFDYTEAVSAMSGFAGGLTVQVPLKKGALQDGGPSLGLDYSYRSTRNTFSGNHAFSVVFNL